MKKIAEKIVSNATKKLIDAMADFAVENFWSDNDFIEALYNCGITETDFIECGYGEFVKEYFS